MIICCVIFGVMREDGIYGDDYLWMRYQVSLILKLADKCPRFALDHILAFANNGVFTVGIRNAREDNLVLSYQSVCCIWFDAMHHKFE